MRRVKIQALTSQLSDGKYEPLWRKFYDEFSPVFEKYPTASEVRLEKNRTKAEKLYAQIEEIMRERGYTGKYPNFSRKGYIFGVHIIGGIIDGGFSVGAKPAEFYIHCDDWWGFGDDFAVNFTSGAKILPKNSAKGTHAACTESDECAGDIMSCLFTSPTTRHLDGFFYANAPGDTEEDSLSALRKKIGAVIKKTEMQKLTADEKKLVGRENDFLASFAILSVIGLVACAVLMALLVMVGFFVLLIFTGFDGVRTSFADMPIFRWYIICYGIWEVIVAVIAAIAK